MFWQKLQKNLFILFLLLVIGSLLSYQIFGADFNLDQIREYVGNFGIWAPLIFLAFYTVITIFIPSTPFMAIAGILFGFKYGLLYTIIGGVLSSLLVFCISRKLGRNKFEKILTIKYLKYLDKYNQRLGHRGIWDLIVLRALPIMPFNVLNILMGLSKIKTEEYIIGTVIGLIPSNILAVYFGNIIYWLF